MSSIIGHAIGVAYIAFNFVGPLAFGLLGLPWWSIIIWCWLQGVFDGINTFINSTFAAFDPLRTRAFWKAAATEWAVNGVKTCFSLAMLYGIGLFALGRYLAGH